MFTTSMRRVSIVAAIAAGIVGAAAPSASAVPPIDVDTIRISGGRADFGDGLHILGKPSGDATVAWRQSGSTIGATVTGTVYYDDASQGGCARVRVGMYDYSGNRVRPDVNSDVACRTGTGSVATAAVSKSLSQTGSPKPYRVKVTTQVGPGSGATFTDTSSANVYFLD